MYQRILAPLDGSPLAECVFPHLETLAAGGQVKEVILARVVEPFRPITSGEYILRPEEVLRIEEETKAAALAYLKEAAAKIKLSGTGVKTEMIIGNPAETLANYASRNKVDLILIATHGRSGVSRWVWGSVADRILRSACVPVLMVRAPGCIPGI
jgi:nucleotide-binding universal stress UspA family protein